MSGVESSSSHDGGWNRLLLQQVRHWEEQRGTVVCGKSGMQQGTDLCPRLLVGGRSQQHVMQWSGSSRIEIGAKGKCVPPNTTWMVNKKINNTQSASLNGKFYHVFIAYWTGFFGLLLPMSVYVVNVPSM